MGRVVVYIVHPVVFWGRFVGVWSTGRTWTMHFHDEREMRLMVTWYCIVHTR